jgi:hypothetical protein
VNGTAIGDIRYTLRTDYGALPEPQPRSVHHGSAEVLARQARGDEADTGIHRFRAGTQIETRRATLTD